MKPTSTTCASTSRTSNGGKAATTLPAPLPISWCAALSSPYGAKGEPTQAKVLDPAAGAGVFLVSAFRQLVAERWRHDENARIPKPFGTFCTVRSSASTSTRLRSALQRWGSTSWPLSWSQSLSR